MKKLIIVLLSIIPLFSFSQGSIKNEIAWINLQEAKILQKQGPIKNAEPKEVLPTKRVTGKKKTEVEVKNTP